jgi:cyclopropane fatty-acyl-phospholipid synthase-like methyltransferase
MNWRAFWEAQALETDPHRQVGRVGGLRPPSDEALAEIAAHLAGLLGLGPGDSLLDVCCGNGRLTRLLAPRCRSALGVDFSAAQIRHAQEDPPLPGLSFQVADALQLSEVLEGPFDKILLYFSFQYFDTRRAGAQVIAHLLRLLAPGGQILVGDVPDWGRLHVFYPSRWARWRYRLSRLLGRDRMGRFWSERKLRRICQRLGAEVEFLPQPPSLPYAHYRFDLRISAKAPR